MFAAAFKEFVGGGDLVYTRNGSGRGLLLRVVQRALLSGEILRADSRWR